MSKQKRLTTILNSDTHDNQPIKRRRLANGTDEQALVTKAIDLFDSATTVAPYSWWVDSVASTLSRQYGDEVTRDDVWNIIDGDDTCSELMDRVADILSELGEGGPDAYADVASILVDTIVDRALMFAAIIDDSEDSTDGV